MVNDSTVKFHNSSAGQTDILKRTVEATNPIKISATFISSSFISWHYYRRADDKTAPRNSITYDQLFMRSSQTNTSATD